MTAKTVTGAGGLPLLLIAEEPLDGTMLEELLGEERIFGFCLGYSEPSERFLELERYRRELELAAGRRGSFRGTAAVDLTAWIGRENADQLDAFLAYLCDTGENIRYVFTAEASESGSDRLYEKLWEYFPAERVRAELCSEVFLRRHLKFFFHRQGVSVSEGVLRRLCQLLSRASEGGTVKLRRLETVCGRLAADCGGCISESALLRFARSAEIRQLCSRRTQRIGFSGEGR